MNTKRLLSAGLVTAAALMMLPSASSAQKLQNGKWTITATTPSGEVVELGLDVTDPNGATKGTLSAPFLQSAVELGGLKLEGKVLSFTFQVEDSVIKCTLERNDAGGFAGPCTDSVNPPGRFEMKPPSASGSAAAAAAPAAGATGAPIEAGRWTGTVQHPSMGEMAFDFDVPAPNNGKATMNIPSIPMTFNVDKLMLDGKKLTFGFVVEGQGDVRCALTQRDDKAYAGTCIEGGGETSPVIMKPPVPKS
jgi:hypothetical protein